MSLKEKIIDTSVKLFNKDGSHAVTTNHIKDDLNISPGTLYYYFKNKEEIVRFIFQQITDEFTTLFQGTGGHITPEEFLDMIKAMYGLLYKYRFFYTDIAMLLQRDPELEKMYSENRKNRYTGQKELYRIFVESQIMREIESADELICILDNLWIVTDFYFTYIVASLGKIKQSDIKKGVQHYLVMMKPYLTDGALKELSPHFE